MIKIIAFIMLVSIAAFGDFELGYFDPGINEDAVNVQLVKILDMEILIDNELHICTYETLRDTIKIEFNGEKYWCYPAIK